MGGSEEGELACQSVNLLQSVSEPRSDIEARIETTYHCLLLLLQLHVQLSSREWSRVPQRTRPGPDTSIPGG